MAGITNRGKYLTLQLWGRAVSPVTSVFYVGLATSAVTPNPDTNTLADVTQIATGNGYSDGGLSVSRNSTDFDVLTEDDTNDRALIQIKDLVWTASGGNLPASGNGARWAVGLTDEATPANRQVWAFWDLSADRTISVSQTLTLQNLEYRLTE